MTRRPNHCIAKVWPLCECGRMIQYQMPMRMNSTKVTTPPMMCRIVLPLRSNGIDTRYGTMDTRKASIQYWKIRRQVTLVSASLTGLAEPGCVLHWAWP